MLTLSSALWAQDDRYIITNVTIVEVETGTLIPEQWILIEGDRIAAVGSLTSIKYPAGAKEVDARGKFIIPGLWDMHVHSHRERRWTYHYPLFRAFGVVGVRDAGSHLGSALSAMERTKSDPMAPHVVWGSPIIDGAPPYNSHGVSAEDADSGRQLVREFHRLGFDFVKVYDRLTPETYRSIAEEARRLGMPVEGHVPLALSPQEATEAGQTLIDHLTLVLESCTPGMLELANEAQRTSPSDTDSLELLMDDAFAANLDRFDAEQCRSLFNRFAEAGIWQVPTLIEMRGFFHADDPAVISDPRIDLTTPALLQGWREWSQVADPARLANGRKVLAAQMRLIPMMQHAGVGIMVGTDASSEPWVFAGASVHDEMALLVEAGLTPAQALRAATLNPLRYVGRATEGRVIAPGERADLVLLDADPLLDIRNTSRISAVFTKGQYHDRAALGGLLILAREQAAIGQQ